MEKRLHAKMVLFIEERLRGVRGDELVHAYQFAHIMVKAMVVLIQGGLLATYFYLAWPFSGEASCPIPQRMRENVGFNHTDCVLPNDGLFFGMAVLDVGLWILLPTLSIFQYWNYWSNEFNNNLQRARRLVDTNKKPLFKKFINWLTGIKIVKVTRMEGDKEIEEEKSIKRGVKIDDVRLTIALLHANVDKYVINKILTIYSMQIDWAHPKRDTDFTAVLPCCSSICKRWNDRLKPKVPPFPFDDAGNNQATAENSV